MNKINIKETFRILHKAFNLLGKYKVIYLVGLILSSAKYAIKFINPLSYKFITDMVLGTLEHNDYIKFLCVVLLFIVLIPVFCYGHYLRSISCVKAQSEIQKSMFSHIVKLPLKNVHQQSSGVYLTKVADDILFVDRLFKKYAFTAFGKFIIFTIISSILLIKVSFKLFLINLGIGSLFLTASLFIVPKIICLEISTKESSTKLHFYIIDFLNNIVMIRVFCIEKPLMRKFSQEVNNITKNRLISKSMVGMWDRFIDLIKIVVQPLSIILMTWLMSNDLSTSDVVFISGVISIYVEGLCKFISFFQNIQNDLVCAKQIFNIFDYQEERYICNSLDYEDSNRSDYIIEFKDVNFSYNRGKTILGDFNLKVKENQFIAIVGESGSGKSTVLKLLQGLYNDYKGQILLNGMSINKYDLNALRSKFSYVSQENLLFNKSIESNIKLIKENVTHDEYLDSVRFAKLDSLIDNPKSIKIGRNGCRLSGGEKQRISIARAVLKDSKIFLLDEFTSALDKNTEEEIFNHFKKFIGKKTIIMVTHRLNYIENADGVIVIRGGQAVGYGTHKELLSHNEYYKNLYRYK